MTFKHKIDIIVTITSTLKELFMKFEFITPELEMIYLVNEDIITTSPIIDEEEPEETKPKVTIGPGGDIGLPFDPFSN